MNTQEFVDLLKREKAIRNAHEEKFLQNLEGTPPAIVNMIDLKINYLYFGCNLIWYTFSNPGIDMDLIAEALLEVPEMNEATLSFPDVVNTWINSYSYSEIPFKRQDSPGSFLDKDQVIDNAFTYNEKELVRQLILAEMFTQYLVQMRRKYMDKNFDSLDSTITHPKVETPLLTLYEEVQQELAVADNITGDLFEGDHFETDPLLNSILTANKGQVVYVDLWATWCGPCIREFKKQAAFKKELENMGVQSVYIYSQSDQATTWKAMVKKYKLEGINIFLNDEQYNSLDSRYDVVGFPTYVIYDQNGKIIH